MLVGKPRRPHALVAAASRRTIDRGSFKRSDSPDAPQLFELVNRCGAIGYAIDVKMNAASKITYYPARLEDPRAEPEPIEDGPALEAFDRLGDFNGHVARMVGQWSVTGEGFLVGQLEDAEEVWRVLSSVEWDRTRVVKRHPDEVVKDNDAFALRSWREALSEREKPDSPLRRIVDEVEQYILLRDMITAVAWSRIPAGILKVPSELVLANPNPNAPPGTDPFSTGLGDALVGAVMDTRSAGRIAPIVVRGPGDALANMEPLDLIRDLPEWVPDLMEKVLRQMATGLNLPAEILTGMGDINHWGQWLIDDSARLNHVDPDILGILDSFTQGYLHPVLREARVADPEQYLFWRDYSDLTSRTLTVDEAMGMFDRGIINLDAILRIADLNEEDAGDGQPIGAVEDIAVTDERGIPDTLVAAATPAVSLGEIDLRLFEKITEASQAALDRALDRAGAKVRSHTQARNGQMQALRTKIDGVPNHLVGLTVGREALQLSDDDLIPPDAFDALGNRVDSILAQGQDEAASATQALTGQEPKRDEATERTWRDRARDLLVASLAALALSRFFTPTLDPDPAETGEIGDSDVPADTVWDTLTVAAGGEPGARDVRGLANGEQTQEWLSEAGAVVESRVWTVGSPAQPFEPHRNLSGVRFNTWEDPALANPRSWPSTAFLHPGDHRFCQCVAVLVVEPPPSVE